VASADEPSAGVECSDGAVVGFVGTADVLSEGVECSDGAVVGSVASADVPSESVECSDGAVVGSVGSADEPQPLDGVFRSSSSEAQFPANGMPVIMFSSSFLLTMPVSSYDSGVTSLGRMPGVDSHQPCGGDGTRPAGGRNCAVQTVHERGLAEEVYSAEEDERCGVFGDDRSVVDSPDYLVRWLLPIVLN